MPEKDKEIMKKYLFIFVLGMFALLSCEEEPLVFDGQVATQTLINFNSTTTGLGIPLGETVSITIDFNVTKTADTDRTFDMVVNADQSNAVAGSVTFGTAVIPAGSYSGSFTITGTDVGLEAGDTRILTIEFVESATVVSDGGLEVEVFLVCESNIPEGAWTDPVGGTVTLTKLSDDEYEFSNFNYGYYNPANNPIRGQFKDICNNVSLQGSTEFGVRWRGSGVYSPGAGTIVFASGVEDDNFNPGIFGPALTFTKQ